MNIPTLNHHVGSTERAFVAHVNDLNDFYLHSESVHESVVNLGRDLYNEYSQSYIKPLGINETLNVGDYCACPSESEDWYRGLIRQFDANGHAIVFKIDCGDVQCVPVQFLRPLQERFFKLPRLAFHCSLANLIRPNNGWSSDIINEFRSRVTTTFLYAKFINYNEIRDISEVEITEKSSKTPLNKDFEQYQIPRSISHMNDKLVYKYIPMETLDPIQPNQIRLLYYISPSRFYVYLREKINSHASFQTDLQKAVQNLHPILSPRRYQPIAAQDNHAVWNRAIILDINSDSSKIHVYLLDIGQREFLSLNNIRPLPEEFQRKPAFAIPCCLNNVCSLNENEQSIWKSNDQVHDEFNRLMINNVTCQVCAKQDQLYYDIDIDIPKIGDLGTFLFDKNLVSHPTMRQYQRPSNNSGQPPQQSFIRAQLSSSAVHPIRSQQQRLTQPNEYYTNPNNMPQQQTIRMSNPGLQTRLQSSTTNNASSIVPIVPPQDGYYTIIQVRSAAEFYGLSQKREDEFRDLSKHLAHYYNNAPNDSSLNVTIFIEGALCIIQESDRYHRVIIKRREGESRIAVKLIDRGDEIIVDTSELLNIDPRFTSIPVFAQPFRLRGFEESQSTANITLSLKKLILNQSVHISQHGTTINGFYPVEVIINNNQSVNKTLFSNDKNLSIISPPSNNRLNLNQPPPTHIESKVFNNSTRHYTPMSQESGGRFEMNQRTNDALPTSSKILTGPTRVQAGRFGGGANPISSSNDPTTRFSNMNNRSQPVDSPAWNTEQNNKPNFSNNAISHQQTFMQTSSQFATNQRADENRSTVINNSDNQQSTFEPKRSSFGGGFNRDDRNEKPPNDSGFRRGGFSNDRGGGFNSDRRGGYNSDRGGRGGFNNRNNEENNDSSGGFSRRTGGFSDRGGRGGGYQDRNNSNRNPGDDHSQTFNNNRGGFSGGRGYQNRRDQGENGDYGRRGGRGGSRGGYRGEELQLSSDTKAFSGWPNTRPTPVNFEAGDRFNESEIPKDSLKFVVSHVESANEFFIQLLAKGDELSSLTEILQNEYKQSPEGNLGSFKVNQACLAKSSDGCWYRAVVLSTGLTKLKIRFIDFGDTTDVDSNTIRSIAKKHCTSAPYAYPCTFENAQVVENVKNDSVITKCAGKEFNGKILTKTLDGKFLLESDELLKLLVEINAIKLKSEGTLKRIKCRIGHIESEQQEFYIQDDEETVDKIAELIENEQANAPILSLDEVQDLKSNTIVLAKYEDELFRGIIIQSNESDENVNICFVDFGNTNSCPKNSLKRSSEQLSSYKYQAKHCRLYGLPSNEINNALTYLGDHSDVENNIEISIINEKDQILHVLVYINNQCINEKFGYNPNTTIVEPEIKEDVPSVSEAPSKYRKGLLTHLEKTTPYVYLQFSPESEAILEQIDTFIEKIIQEDKHNSSYEIGDYIIAKFSEDDRHYRARIESYHSSTQFYTVYFLDYGNIDENVPIEHLYSYTDELKQIEPQVHGYLLDQVNSETWTHIVRPLVEDHLDAAIQFYYSDKDQSRIHIKFDNENEIYNIQEPPKEEEEEQRTFPANISAIDHDCFYIQMISDENLRISEMEEVLQNYAKERKESWTTNEFCLVSNEENKYYRGQILAIHEEKYDVKCIDYGNTLHDITSDHLYEVPDEEIFKKAPLAYQCRLHGVDEDNQVKAIEESIRIIPTNERVMITVENKRKDSCLFVTLIRENNEIDDIEDENKQKSDNDEEKEIMLLDSENSDEQPNQSSDPIDNHSITNNQTIDFGENDPSTTTIKDETNNSISSN